MYYVVKNSKGKLDHKIPIFAPQIFSLLQKYLHEDMIDDVDEEFLSQYVVALLNIIESYLSNSENQILGWVESEGKKAELVKIINKCLHFNPNMPGFLGGADSSDKGSDASGSDSEDGSDQSDGDQGDADDSSWKVRKSAVQLLFTCHSLRSSSHSKYFIQSCVGNAVALTAFKDDYVQPKLLELFMELFYQFQSYFEDGNKIAADLFKNLSLAFSRNPQNKTLGLIARTIGKLSAFAPPFFKQKWAEVFGLFKAPLADSKITDIDLLGEYLDAIGVIISSSHLADAENCYFENSTQDLIQISLKAI